MTVILAKVFLILLLVAFDSALVFWLPYFFVSGRPIIKSESWILGYNNSAGYFCALITVFITSVGLFLLFAWLRKYVFASDISGRLLDEDIC